MRRLLFPDIPESAMVYFLIAPSILLAPGQMGTSTIPLKPKQSSARLVRLPDPELSDHTALGQLPVNPGAQFVIQYTAGIYFPEGDYSIYANGDDGHSITIPGVSFVNRFGNVNGVPASDELRYEAPTGNSNQGAQFSIGPGGLVTTFEAVWFERTGRDFFEVENRTGFGTKGSGPDTEWDIRSETADDSGIAINSTPFTPVPEPGTGLLGLLAAGILIAKRRR